MAETTTTAWHFPEFVHWFQKNCLRSSNGPMATLILMLNPQYGDTPVELLKLLWWCMTLSHGKQLTGECCSKDVDRLTSYVSGEAERVLDYNSRNIGRQFLPVSIEIQIFPSGGGRTDVVCSPAGREGQVERGAFQTERPYDVGVTGETNGNRWRKEKTI